MSWELKTIRAKARVRVRVKIRVIFYARVI